MTLLDLTWADFFNPRALLAPLCVLLGYWIGRLR